MSGYESQAVVLYRGDYERLARAAAHAEEAMELFRRTRAEFLNYQDRARREREEALRYGSMDFAREFLPALDSLRDAIALVERNDADPAIVEGLRLLDREFHRVLAKAGVTRMEVVGRPFDPAQHEAVGTVEVETDRVGIVVEEVRSGYRLYERVLRAAWVRVGSPAKKEPDGGAGA